jgi:hypothetical protein
MVHMGEDQKMVSTIGIRGDLVGYFVLINKGLWGAPD